MGSRNSTLPMVVGMCGAGVVLLLGLAVGVFTWLQMRNREMSRAVEESVRAKDDMLAQAAAQAHAEARSKAEQAKTPEVDRSGENEVLRLQVRGLEEKLSQAMNRIAELEAKAGAVAAESEPQPRALTAAERLTKVKEQFAKLTEAGMFAMGGSEFQELLKELKEVGEDGVTMLTEALLKGESAKERFMAGALLEGLANPSSVKALIQSAREESDLLVRRMAVHALAVARFEDGKETLAWSMGNDADWGVRVNAAYGLAKMGEKRGVDEMVKWYESPETEAQYKLAVLGGISDVGDPSTAPLFRTLLNTSKDMTALLLAIQGATNTKDTSLVPDLQRVADTNAVQAVKEAAQKAIKALRGY